ncbi:MAG: LytTR family DNA-binding domain-containing protein [Bacteroidales bacterium]
MKTSDLREKIARVHDIDFMFVCKGYTVLMRKGGDQDVVDMPLFAIERELDRHAFFRIHKSYIVNLQKVKELEVNDSRVSIRMNGQSLPVSRRRKQALLRVLGSRK